MVLPEVEEKLRKLASLDQQGARSAWLMFLSGTGEERQEAEELLDILLFQHASKDFRERIFLDPGLPTDCRGEYELGAVLYPSGARYCAFGLREDEWIKHVLIAGMTGAGKTNLAFHILREFRRHRKPFIVFDWKQNYRDLLQLPECADAIVFTVSRDTAPFQFNPLIPPAGTSAGEWLMKLVDVIKHAYFVGEGVEFLLREAIDWVYEKCGSTETPTFEAVKNYVYRKPLQGRMGLWKASALRVLEAMCFRHGLGRVVGAAHGLDTRLLEQPVILELDALSDSDKVFLTEAIILWLYEFRKHEGRRETFKHALVIEEAHHVLSERKESAEGVETIMETCLRQIREFGEAVVVIDQEPSKLSNSIKANTYCKIVFNLGNGKDILDVSACMSLTREESAFIDWLDVGQAIVSLKGRVRTPLLVGFPHVKLWKGTITDSDVSSTTS